MKHLVVSAVAIVVAGTSGQIGAAEITLIGPGGIRAAAQQLIPEFERRTGHVVKATFGAGGATKDRVVKGDPIDVSIVQPPLQPVVASGHVVPASETLLASVPIGLAVRTGAPKPDISTAAAVKRLLLDAGSIAYPNAAGSSAGGGAGVSINVTLAMLGIAEALQPKIKSAPNGAGAMAMVARGEVEIGLTYLSEMMSEPGIVVVDVLPRDISTPTRLVGFVSTHAKDAAAAQALLGYLSGPEAAAVYKALGMTPRP